MLGTAIAAGASILGGILGNKAQKKANEQNAALQREFAQNSVQWKVADAKKAGVHPVYALGAPTMSAAPSYVGDTSLPSAMASVGQNIGRAVDATRTAGQKIDAFTQTARALELERASLQNDILRADLAAKVSHSVSTPPMASATDPYMMPGQTQSGVTTKALEQTASSPVGPWSEAGSVNETGWGRTPSGLTPIPSSDFKQRSEDMLIPELMWALRNHVLPTLGYNRNMPPTSPGKGKAWQWNPVTQEYYPVTLGRR